MLSTIAIVLRLKKRGKMNGSSRTPVNSLMPLVFSRPWYWMLFNVTSFLRRIFIVTSGLMPSGLAIEPP